MSIEIDNESLSLVFCSGVVLLLFCLGWGLYLIFYVLFFLHSERIKKVAWQLFATTNHLDFDPARFPRKRAKVHGNYRGHHLRLETIPKGKNGQLYSQIVISRGNNRSLNKDKDILSEQILYGDTSHLHTSTDLAFGLKGQINAKAGGTEMYYVQYGTESNTKYLQFLVDLMCDFIDSYRVIVNLGGEAVPYLKTSAKNRRLRPVVRQMLQDIAYETEIQLGHRTSHLLCPACLANFGAHQEQLSFGLPITYYGCRLCGQSRKYFDGHVIAVLDRRDVTEQIQRDGRLWINWLTYRSLFDFDEVEILQATDEDVERFAVQVGNDTDTIRKRQYRKMNCRIAADCKLTENTIRILQQTFGQVEKREQKK